MLISGTAPDGIVTDWGGAVSATTSVPIFVAPFRLRIIYAALSPWSAGVTASDTDYWSITVSRYRSAVAATIGTKTTKITGGEAMTQRVAWVFDSSAFDTSVATLNQNDIAAFIFTKNGVAANVSAPVMTIHYVRA